MCPLRILGQFRCRRTVMNGRALVLFPALALALGGVAQAQGRDKYIVSFVPGTSQAQKADVVRGAGASLRCNYSIIDAAAITVGKPNQLATHNRITATT